MTTDLERMADNAVAVLSNTTDALHRLAEWVEAANHAHTLVWKLIDTAFVPATFWPKLPDRPTAEQLAKAKTTAAANATAAVLQGITLGLDPLTAMSQIYVVHGRPGMYTKMMVALIQAHGHEVWTEDLTDTRAVVCGRRKGTDYVERVAVTMDQARRAGWTNNPSQAYTKTPQDMLWSRAAGRVCDRIASDVIKGIASVEEIQDEIKATAEAGNSTRTVSPRRRTPPPAIDATVEDPALEAAEEAAESADQPPPEPAPVLISPAQSRKLYAALRESGRGDRKTALVYIAGIVGRDIESTKDLTVREAGAVIDNLETMLNAEPPLDEPELAGQLPDGVDGWPVVAQPPASPQLIED